MKKSLFLILLISFSLLIFSLLKVGQMSQIFRKRPFVIWYVGSKYVEKDFFDKVEKYRPDIVLLIVFAEDDVIPFNGTNFDLKGFVERLHKLGVKVYYSYSLFSRSMYEEIKNTSLPVKEYMHVSRYAKYLRENDEKRYHELFDYYLKRGLDPESIPMVKRKPVEGFYVEIGHYSMIDPLYKPYREFLVKVINETIGIKKPDGLAFDHARFFTFDEGYNEDIRDYILTNFGLDIFNYTPKPPFILDATNWTEEDVIYYYSRAKVIEYATSDILNKFPEYKKFGTTMGTIDPARANGQYVELQANTFDGLLLMAYDKDPSKVAKNVKETKEKADGKIVILGISKLTEDVAIQNIQAGLKSGADGIYLLGYDFNEEIHKYLLKVRNLN